MIYWHAHLSLQPHFACGLQGGVMTLEPSEMCDDNGTSKDAWFAWCKATAFPNLIDLLTHRGRDKMAAISNIAFPDAFSSMKMLEFRLKFQ